MLSALATAGFRLAYVPIEDREFGKYVRHTAISVALIKLKAVSIQDEIYEQASDQLRHYAEQRHHGVINMALNTIVSKFFNGKN